MPHAFRLIHALRVDLGPIHGGGPTSRCEIIVNLARDGRNILKSGARPRPPKVRMIDVRSGDQILYNGQWVTVYGVRAFLDSWLTAEQAAAISDNSRGYLYRVVNPPAEIPNCAPLHRE